ncbi:MAG: sensor histidine kinase [Bacillota bacterium]
MPVFASLADKLVIFICCMIIYLVHTDLNTGVAAILISVIFSGFLSYFDDDRVKTALTVGFIVLSCFVPPLIFFLPLTSYDMLFSKYQYVNLLGIIPVLNFARSASVQTLSAIIILLALSILVKYHMESQTRLYARCNELGDAAREMMIQLKKQRSELMENQDIELNLATLNERNRIAREIHDNVGHLLSSAILQAGALLTVNRDEKIRDSLETLNDTLSQAMDSIRASVHKLYDESIDLDAQIKELVKKFTFCEISYEYNIDSNPGKKLKYAFISIVKEALSNIIKHSNATHASIIFNEHPALYQLIIRDNGTVKSSGADDGLGLMNITERVRSFNGNINILTENGFEIFISIPKEGSGHENTDRG